MKRKGIFLIVAALVFGSVSLSARDDDDDYNQYGQKVDSKPAKALVQDGIMVFSAKKIDYKMWFDIRVQGDAAVYFGAPDFCAKKLDGKENPNHIGYGAMIRRARFAVKAQLDGNWYGEIDTDWSSGKPEIKDAILAYTGVPGLELKAGNFKENFSIQRNTSSRYLMFMERPMVTSLAPSRHIGVNATYSYKWLWASAGVFGPALAGIEELTFIQDNNKKYGRNMGLATTGKLVFRPFYGKENLGLHVGGAFSWRQPSTEVDPLEYGSARYSTRNSTSINRKKYLDTDLIRGMHHELLWTAELAGFWKGLRYEGAYIARGAYLDQEINAKGPQWAKGWYAQASYLLFGGSQNYDSDGAKPTRVTPGRKWGDIELAFRYEFCDFNTADYFGGSAEAYTVGVNFYPMKNIKFAINYQFNNNDRYANGKGKLYVGRDETGKPVTDPMKAVSDNGRIGVDYHMLAVRFQVAF